MAELWDERRQLTRRRFLGAGAAGAATAVAGPTLWRQAWAAAAPPVDPHLSFGADPRTQVTLSWRTPGSSVAGQGLRVLDGADAIAVPDIEVRTVDRAPSVYSHAQLAGLEPGRRYRYELLADGEVAFASTFSTAPNNPRRFTFTALGDQGTDDVKARGVSAAVAAQDPALHLHVGDLCYAYRLGAGFEDGRQAVFDTLAAVDGVAMDHAAWDRWLALTSTPSGPAGGGAHSIPWMAAVGNHEMEPTYGPTGYRGMTGRVALPGNGVPSGDRRDDVTWTVDYGNVRFIALDGNDANHELPGNQGYLGGAQTAWLEGVLADARRAGSGIDFVVVGYHQCNYCTNLLHASDAGTRRWDDLFRTYGVDLVINGHNHSYERAHPFASAPDEPAAVRFPSGSVVTPADGTTFVTAGAGGNERLEVSAYEAGMVSYVTEQGGVRLPEVAHWSAARRLGPSSFVRVDVDCGSGPGSTTTMSVQAIEVVAGVVGATFDAVTIERAVGDRGR